jgi:hypothetical protein
MQNNIYMYKWIKECSAFLERFRDGSSECGKRYDNKYNDDNVKMCQVGIKYLDELKKALMQDDERERSLNIKERESLIELFKNA